MVNGFHLLFFGNITTKKTKFQINSEKKYLNTDYQGKKFFTVRRI